MNWYAWLCPADSHRSTRRSFYQFWKYENRKWEVQILSWAYTHDSRIRNQYFKKIPTRVSSTSHKCRWSYWWTSPLSSQYRISYHSYSKSPRGYPYWHIYTVLWGFLEVSEEKVKTTYSIYLLIFILFYWPREKFSSSFFGASSLSDFCSSSCCSFLSYPLNQSGFPDKT